MKRIIAVYATQQMPTPSPVHVTVTDAMSGKEEHVIDLERGTVYAGVVMGIVWAWKKAAPDVIYTNSTAVVGVFNAEGTRVFTINDGCDMLTRQRLHWCECRVNADGFPAGLVQWWSKSVMTETDIRDSWKFFKSLPQDFVDDFELVPCNYERRIDQVPSCGR